MDSLACPRGTILANEPSRRNIKMFSAFIADAGDRRPVGLKGMRARKIATSTAARRLDCSDVDLFHLHHRIERALGGSGIGIGYRFGQSDRRDLPRQSPFVLAPAARTLFAAVADDRVPVTISFGLVSGCDLKRERFVV